MHGLRLPQILHLGCRNARAAMIEMNLYCCYVMFWCTSIAGAPQWALRCRNVRGGISCNAARAAIGVEGPQYSPEKFFISLKNSPPCPDLNLGLPRCQANMLPIELSYQQYDLYSIFHRGMMPNTNLFVSKVYTRQWHLEIFNPRLYLRKRPIQN